MDDESSPQSFLMLAADVDTHQVSSAAQPIAANTMKDLQAQHKRATKDLKAEHKRSTENLVAGQKIEEEKLMAKHEVGKENLKTTGTTSLQCPTERSTWREDFGGAGRLSMEQAHTIVSCCS